MTQTAKPELNNLLTALVRRTVLEETMATRKVELAMQEGLRKQTTKNADKAAGHCRCSLRPQACATTGCTEDLL